MDSDTRVYVVYLGDGAGREEKPIDVKGLLSLKIEYGGTEYRVSTRHGKLEISIGGLLIIHPVASNKIELEEVDYHAKKET